MAWSGPKIWKFYKQVQIAHPDDLPAAIGVDKFVAIKNLVITDNQNINTPVINTAAESEVYKLIKYQGKTFLDVLEARKEKKHMVYNKRRLRHDKYRYGLQ